MATSLGAVDAIVSPSRETYQPDNYKEVLTYSHTTETYLEEGMNMNYGKGQLFTTTQTDGLHQIPTVMVNMTFTEPHARQKVES